MFSILAAGVASKSGIAAIILFWLVAVAGLQAVAPPLSEVTTNEQEEFLPAGTESLRAMQIAAAKFPTGEGIPGILVVHGERPFTSAELAAIEQLDGVLRSPAAPDDIASVRSVFSMPQASQAFIAPDGQTMTLLLTVAGSPADESFGAVVDWIRDRAAEAVAGTSLEVAVTGPAGISTDAVRVFTEIDLRVTLTTVGLVLVILLLIYRSPLLALLPLLCVSWALLMAQSVTAMLADQFGLPLNAQVTSIMSVLMFGAGTDFTLFIVARYREEWGRQPTRWKAMQVAMSHVGPAIASSAGTTMVAMLALLLATFGSFRALGPMLAAAILIMLAVGLTLVPALTVLLGRAAFWPRLPQNASAQTSTFWSRVAALVARRPGTVFGATALLLVVASLGVPTIKPSFNFLQGFPANVDSRRGFELLQRSFPAGELAPTQVVVTTEDDDVLQHIAALDVLAAALSGEAKILRVSGPSRPFGEAPPLGVEVLQAAVDGLPRDALEDGPPTPRPAPNQQALWNVLLAGRRFVSPDRTTAKLEVVLSSDPYGVPALDQISRTREVARSAIAATSLEGSEVLVGGPTAIQADTRTSVNRDARLVGPIVIAAIWVILAMLLRSLVAPTYLVASVLLSFLAALGLSTVVFQSIFGHEGVGYQNGVWMFIFLVALGVDYNIYIMSRVREEVGRSGLADGTRRAISRTGGVITSAGIILAGTFSVLATLPLRDIVQLGFAVMLGILLDTFVVRALLVPSMVLLLGRWNWWPSRPLAVEPAAAPHAAMPAGEQAT
ncbi:MAG: hypothetical protein CL878_15535 [Dehalococcoidia bacterium]|nr:hypothetical protein [Dehalococcoidia bacterium]